MGNDAGKSTLERCHMHKRTAFPLSFDAAAAHLNTTGLKKEKGRKERDGLLAEVNSKMLGAASQSCQMMDAGEAYRE